MSGLVVVSPHLDDALFSVAEHLASESDVVIATAMGAVPDDPAGVAKMERLHREHATAVAQIGARRFDGPFLDDCYPAPDPAGLDVWFDAVVAMADRLWIPAGVHHPDHLLCSNAAVAAWDRAGRPVPIAVYEELPYRVLYPAVTTARLAILTDRIGPLALTGYPSTNLAAKRDLVGCYVSQVGEDVARCLYVPERLWGQA